MLLGSGGDYPLPEFRTPATPGVSPTPTALPPFGDGGSGVLTVAGATSVTVNDCYATTGSNGTLRVETPHALSSNDWLLVLQTQHPDLDAGLFEIAVIASIPTAGTLALASSLQRTYTDGAQLCTLPRFSSVSIGAASNVRPDPWDGKAGGVVAFLVSGELTLQGQVTAVGDGFQGGLCSAVSDGTGHSNMDNDPNAGEQGHSALGKGHAGRNPNGYGGGGGNPQRGGGAGGGNGGSGGGGGAGNPGKPMGLAADARGEGGGASPEPGRLYLGAGGGGGQTKIAIVSKENACDGSDGGGIIFVQAASLSGNGTLRAGGQAAAGTIADGYSGGGGGAGGTIYLRAETSTGFTGQLRVNGSDGEDSSLEGVSLTGPGGGGGGGFVIVAGGDGLPAAAAPSLDFGVAGQCNGDPHMAEDGDPGVELTVP